MEQSTVLLLVGIIGNLALVLLLLVAWRLLMSNRSAGVVREVSRDQGYQASDGDAEYDEYGEQVYLTKPAPAAGADDAAEQLAGLFRFDSWTAVSGNAGPAHDVLRNGRSNAMDG